MDIRDDKLALKALLMKNVKTNNTGKAVITKDDEWREECEWDIIADVLDKAIKRKGLNEKQIHEIDNEIKKLSHNPSIDLSFIDMLFDKEKRQAIYTKYDKNYQSTKEEDEIYNEMRGRYREDKDI